jgi:hypothetical protein
VHARLTPSPIIKRFGTSALPVLSSRSDRPLAECTDVLNCVEVSSKRPHILRTTGQHAMLSCGVRPCLALLSACGDDCSRELFPVHVMHTISCINEGSNEDHNSFCWESHSCMVQAHGAHAAEQRPESHGHFLHFAKRTAMLKSRRDCKRHGFQSSEEC